MVYSIINNHFHPVYETPFTLLRFINNFQPFVKTQLSNTRTHRRALLLLYAFFPPRELPKKLLFLPPYEDPSAERRG